MTDPKIDKDADYLMAYASYCIERGELLLALRASAEARDLYEDAGNAAGSAEANQMLGQLYYLQREYKKALPLLASAQQQYASLQLPLKRCLTLYLLALCHKMLGKPNKAAYTIDLAAKLLDEIDDVKHKNLLKSLFSQLKTEPTA
ncbi:MAG: hypothetical protein RMM17_03740 [Acidobacteriota bacterium]|nr:hypothetical protein [Blastocatellia bacterium]MDW8411781.1 hypothetical protein [Acidobacteriota bacterium]